MTLDQILYYAGAVAVCIGPLGSFVELLGATFKLPRVVTFGQRLEALGADLPKFWRGSRANKLQAELDLLKGDGPKTPRSVPPIGPAAAGLMLLGALALSCSGPAMEKPPCDEATLAQIVATCRTESECNLLLDERQARCAKQIKEEP